MRRALVFVVVLLVARVAAAEERNVVSVPVLALGDGGLTLQGERYLDRRWSVAVSLGARRAAEGDYDSLSAAAGVEGRWYWKGRARGTGPYVGARLAAASATLSDGTGDSIGATTSLAESVMVGWRWRIRRVEITPAIGMTVRTELPDNGLAPETASFLTVGWTVGWMW